MKRYFLSKRLLILFPLLSILSLTGSSPNGRILVKNETVVDSVAVREIRISNKDKLTKILYEVKRITKEDRP